MPWTSTLPKTPSPASMRTRSSAYPQTSTSTSGVLTADADHAQAVVQRGLAVGEAQRRADRPHLAEHQVLVLDDRAAGLRLRVDERLLDGVGIREAGTPAATSASTHSSTVRSRNDSSSRSSSSSRCSFRAAIVANRSSSASSGRPITVQSRSPEDLLRGPDDEPAVGRLEVLEGDDRRMRRLRAPRRYEAVGRRPRPDVHQLVERGLEERRSSAAELR